MRNLDRIKCDLHKRCIPDTRLLVPLYASSQQSRLSGHSTRSQPSVRYEVQTSTIHNAVGGGVCSLQRLKVNTCIRKLASTKGLPVCYRSTISVMC